MQNRTNGGHSGTTDLVSAEKLRKMMLNRALRDE